MLLKLQNPARLNRYVQPLGLASQCAEPGELCSVSGDVCRPPPPHWPPPGILG
uniref:Uncharacterized protein n=1 Tax=Gopherus agassizii TaxID=38772 RepID=A0A452GP78_9SAUR